MKNKLVCCTFKIEVVNISFCDILCVAHTYLLALGSDEKKQPRPIVFTHLNFVNLHLMKERKIFKCLYLLYFCQFYKMQLKLA